MHLDDNNPERPDDIPDDILDDPFVIVNGVGGVDSDDDGGSELDEFMAMDSDEDENLDQERIQSISQALEDQYRHYMLLNGNNELPSVEANNVDDEDDEDAEASDNVRYQQQISVEWIQTDEPIFDRQTFDEALRRQVVFQQQQQEQQSSQAEIKPSSGPSHSRKNEPDAATSSEKESENKPESSQSQAIPLENEKVDTIKNLMANFALPSENIPEWAEEIPEEKWKSFLIDKTSGV